MEKNRMLTVMTGGLDNPRYFVDGTEVTQAEYSKYLPEAQEVTGEDDAFTRGLLKGLPEYLPEAQKGTGDEGDAFTRGLLKGLPEKKTNR